MIDTIYQKDKSYLTDGSILLVVSMTNSIDRLYRSIVLVTIWGDCPVKGAGDQWFGIKAFHEKIGALKVATSHRSL